MPKNIMQSDGCGELKTNLFDVIYSPTGVTHTHLDRPIRLAQERIIRSTACKHEGIYSSSTVHHGVRTVRYKDIVPCTADEYVGSMQRADNRFSAIAGDIKPGILEGDRITAVFVPRAVRGVPICQCL